MTLQCVPGSRLRNMLFAIVLGVSLLFGVRASLRIQDVEVTNEGNLIRCIRVTSEKYFLQSQNVEIIAQVPPDSLVKSFEGYATVVRTASDLLLPDFRPMITKYAVIFLERPNYTEDVKMLRSLEKFDPQGRYIVSINNEVDPSNLEEYLTNITGYLASMERWNVAILMNDLENGGTRAFSYTLYSSGNCTRTPKIIDHGDCSNSVTSGNLFPVFVNFGKCPVRLTPAQRWPYSMIESKNGQKYIHGIESNAVNSIVRIFNATPEISEVDSANCRRGMIQNRSADVAWGHIQEYTLPGTLFAQACMQVRVFIAIPERAALPSWMNLVLPFSTEVWIALGLVIAVPLIINVLVPRVRRAFAVEYLLAGVTGTGLSRSPSKLSQRLYYMIWLIGGYVIMQAYLGNLTGILTSPPQQKQIQSIDELEKSQISIHGRPPIREQIHETYPEISRNWKDMSTEEYYYNIFKIRTGKGGVATYIPDIKIPNITLGRKSHFHVIPEAFNIFPLSLLMPNSSVLLEGSNRIIGRLSAAGFFDFWKKKYIQQTLTDRSALQNDDNDAMLSLSDLKPLFLILFIGYGISIVTFFIELYTAWPTA